MKTIIFIIGRHYFKTIFFLFYDKKKFIVTLMLYRYKMLESQLHIFCWRILFHRTYAPEMIIYLKKDLHNLSKLSIIKRPLISYTWQLSQISLFYLQNFIRNLIQIIFLQLYNISLLLTKSNYTLLNNE